MEYGQYARPMQAMQYFKNKQTKKLMLFEIDNLKTSDTAIRYCKKCNAGTEHFVYRTWIKARGKYGFAKQCIKCRREKDRIAAATNETRKEQIRNAQNRFKKAGKWDKRRGKYNEKQRFKQKQITYQKRVEKQLALIDLGAYSLIYAIDCKKCGKKEIRRKPYRDGNICGYCHISNIHSQLIILEKTCIDCGNVFKGNHFKRRCSTCLAVNFKMQVKIHRSRRNALKRLASIAEPVSPEKVFKRDKWRCRMCNKKVQNKIALKPDSAELDHIVPLSKGGVHTYSNVQCLCRQCNGMQGKGARLIGQLTLQM